MSNSIDTQHLRPIEKRVLELRQEGMAIEEIASRFNRSPEFVGRILDWVEIPRNGTTTERHLTPRQRRVLDLRKQGESHAQIGDRFKRGERYVRQVEGLAHFKEAQRLLTET